MNTFIIAEAGVNHNGDLTRAIQLIDIAADAGADAVKFQTFKSEELATQAAAKAEYQKKLTDSDESQIDMLKNLELSHANHFILSEHCKTRGIEFMSTAFDTKSIKFLLSHMSLKRLKVPSGEITNLPLIYEHALSGLDIILSTGMATLGEIELALKVICAGYLRGNGIDLGTDWDAAYCHPDSELLLKTKVTILHCVTDYPASPNILNLNAITTISNAFSLPVGFSDHSLGIWAPTVAVALGASVIEKHFTTDKDLPGPDHKASLDPEELKAMIKNIRSTEKALGSGIKKPNAAELVNKQPIRKSIVVKTVIAKGELITEDNITVMRPEGGLSPSMYWDVLNKPAKRDFVPGELYEI